MKIKQLVVSICSTNCYIAINENNKCFVVDPGASAGKIFDLIKNEGLTCEGILITHGHYDHVDAAGKLQTLCEEATGIKPLVYIHELDRSTLEDPEQNVSEWLTRRPIVYKADVYLKSDEIFEVAGFEIKCIFTPGHTPGGCCYYVARDEILFSGDTLFCESIGRTDLKGSSTKALVDSVRNSLFALPEATKVLPGHGEPTTIGVEMEYNPFV